MPSLHNTVDTTTNYSKFRLPLKASAQITSYYQLGLEAFENGLDEKPDNDPAFTMAILAEPENIYDLTDWKAHWRNGWMDAYTNKHLRSTTS